MPDKLSAEIDSTPKTPYNPLDEPVNDKIYSRPDIKPDTASINTPIPEKPFTPPPSSKPSEAEPQKKKEEPVNPGLTDLPNKDKEMAAEQMADMLIKGYGWCHQLANKGLMISKRKVDKLHQAGEINLDVQIQYSYDKWMTAGKFFETYNKEVEHVFVLDDEFKEDVRPPLIRILKKKGIGLTDENYLMVAFAKDIGVKSTMFVQHRAHLREMINVIKEATMSGKRPPAPPPPPPQSSSTPPPPPPPTPGDNDADNFYQEAEVVGTSRKGKGEKPTIVPEKLNTDRRVSRKKL